MIRRNNTMGRPYHAINGLIVAFGFVLPFGCTQAAPAAITDSVRFFVLDRLMTPAVPDSNLVFVEPAEAAAHTLAMYYGIADSIRKDFSALPDPLRIPNPFDRSVERSPDLLQRTTARLQQFGITSKISYPESFAEAEKTVARHIARGYPVLTVHPRPLLLFGYDYREADPLWYVQRFSPSGKIHIVTRSQWRAGWWLWEPTPTSVILLKITGPDTVETTPLAPDVVLSRILTTARTDTTTGVTSYIRPVLRLIDTLSTASAPPQLVGLLENPDDPLGLFRAEIQRVRFREYLETLAPRAREKRVQESMRLAIYSVGKAAEEFAAARRKMYGDPQTEAATDTMTVVDSIADRWVENRLEAADHLSEVIRWERQMLDAIREITAKAKPFRQ